MHFDVVHAADPRFYGGSSSAVRIEIQSARQFGLSTALLPFLGVSDIRSRRFEERLLDVLERQEVPWLTGEEPVECDILFAHNPLAFAHMPTRPLRVRSKVVLLSVQHPPFDGAGNAQYDIDVVKRNLERMFGAPVIFAPVGPKVRNQFEDIIAGRPELLRHDLFNLIDLDEWPIRTAQPPRERAVIGRHSRRDLLKWPDTEAELRAAYPDLGNVQIKVMGGVPDQIVPLIGSNWNISPYSNSGVPQFLNKLDFYVFFHSRRWVEAFGIGIAEAMASGLVTILDPSFRDLFEEGAVYCRPEETTGVVERFLSSPEAFSAQSAAARTLVEKKFSKSRYPERMRAIYDELGLCSPAALATIGKAVGADAFSGSSGHATVRSGPRRSQRSLMGRRRVLFVATNGIGLGHITRLMAIAERMSPDMEPVFLTMSAGSSIIEARGHPVDYIPSAPKIGVTDDSWNEVFAQELLAAVEAFAINSVVFDSNHPFPGLLKVLAARPDLNWVWIRRGMWASRHGLDPSMQHRFDMVIEPGEFAADEDHGITAQLRAGVIGVSPILLVDSDDRLSRAEAALALGVDPAGLVAVVQLGSERNFDVSRLRPAIIDGLLKHGVQVVDAVNPLAPKREDHMGGTVQKAIYPIARYFNAVDLMITNAGYNSFHECIYGGMPAIFVPNEAPEMDEQAVRAAYAQSSGLGLCLRSVDAERAHEAIELALSEGFLAQHRTRASRIVFANGAREAALAIEELAFSVRTDRGLGGSIARV
ncbi:glycosyltransferase [Rhizobium etli]|uniref:Glycosyltransferase involved in cell wall biosynthesis n=1 Tax=Rhizobium etli TaxID=29449 RepID=A0A7W6ZJY1_RHIET|nr:glycosyltransferase [Rhizobium etli]MBB4481290.1 glycosyltransferase involved in cell wall biosynthesis [Rhizobium etli]MBB4537097.1 glycosyltransferase involved in cell wall biosynthesis [Rhizobium etli]